MFDMSNPDAQQMMDRIIEVYTLGAIDALELLVELDLDPRMFLEGIREQVDLDTWEKECQG